MGSCHVIAKRKKIQLCGRTQTTFQSKGYQQMRCKIPVSRRAIKCEWTDRYQEARHGITEEPQRPKILRLHWPTFGVVAPDIL